MLLRVKVFQIRKRNQSSGESHLLNITANNRNRNWITKNKDID